LNAKRLHQKYSELNALFKSYVSSFHGDGGFSFSLQDVKVLQLFDLLNKKNVKNAVEYGTRTTSLAMAYYSNTKNTKYLGLDESEKWVGLNSERLSSCLGGMENAQIKNANGVDNLGEETYFTNLDCNPT